MFLVEVVFNIISFLSGTLSPLSSSACALIWIKEGSTFCEVRRFPTLTCTAWDSASSLASWWLPQSLSPMVTGVHLFINITIFQVLEDAKNAPSVDKNKRRAICWHSIPNKSIAAWKHSLAPISSSAADDPSLFSSIIFIIIQLKLVKQNCFTKFVQFFSVPKGNEKSLSYESLRIVSYKSMRRLCVHS